MVFGSFGPFEVFIVLLAADFVAVSPEFAPARLTSSGTARSESDAGPPTEGAESLRSGLRLVRSGLRLVRSVFSATSNNIVITN